MCITRFASLAAALLASAACLSCRSAAFPDVATILSENGVEWGDTRDEAIRKMGAGSWSVAIDDPEGGFIEFAGGTFLGVSGGRARLHDPVADGRSGIDAGRFMIETSTYEEARRLYDTLARVALASLGEPDHRRCDSERIDYRDCVEWGERSEWFPSSTFTMKVSVAAHAGEAESRNQPHFTVDYYAAIPD